MQTAVTPTTNPLPIHVNKHLVTFCTVAVFLYALSRFWIGAKISAYFEAAFLLPFYYVVFKNWWYFKKQFLTWLVIAMLAVPILQFFVQYYQDPILAMKYQGVDKLFRLSFFLAAAFWLAHNLKLVSWFIAANLLALLILLFSQNNLDILYNRTLSGRRTSWGEVNAQFAAIYAGIGLIASLCLLSLTKNGPLKYKVPLLVFVFICVISTVFVLFASQTRAAIGGLLIVLFTTGILIIYHQNISVKKVIKSPAFIIGFLAITIGLSSALNQSAISDKLKKDWKGIINNQEGLIPNTLGSGRGELWMYASKLIFEKPLIGYGGEARKDLIINAGESLSSRSKRGLHHAHNSWLDTGIAYGLIGLLLLSVFIAYLLYIFTKQRSKNSIPNHIALFSILSLCFLVVVNQFESYFFFWQGGYLLFWVASPAVAFIYAKIIASHEHNKLEDNYAPKNA